MAISQFHTPLAHERLVGQQVAQSGDFVQGIDGTTQTQTHSLRFEYILPMLRAGSHFRRKFWSSDWRYLIMNEYKNFSILNEDGTHRGWMTWHDDIAAEDWELVIPPEKQGPTIPDCVEVRNADFAQAMRALKFNRFVKRPAWTGDRHYAFLELGKIKLRRDKEIVDWECFQDDILANDWIISDITTPHDWAT